MTKTGAGGGGHARRRATLAAALAAADLPALLVTDLVNVRYLTGFTGSNGALLVTAGGTAVLASDGRYTTQMARQAPDVPALTDRWPAGALLARAPGRLGFEPHALTVAAHTALAGVADGPGLIPAPPLVERLREIKDEDELALLREAFAIADAALTGLLGELRAGLTEREVRDELELRMRRGGADGPSFETIVASGPNSAVPHHRPTGRELQVGDLVTIDFGALSAGYHSDCTRTVVLGPPADWQRELYDLVAAAAAAGRSAVRAGSATGEVDAAARDVVEAAGRGDLFPHGLGHGVGLQIHEAPWLSPARAGQQDGDAARLAGRMAVTVEPGVYLPERGGVRIEDTLVVRADGAEVLTSTDRELLVL